MEYFQKTVRVPESTSKETLDILYDEKCNIVDVIPLFGYVTIQCIMKTSENKRIINLFDFH